jgi:hypothetical protein
MLEQDHIAITNSLKRYTAARFNSQTSDSVKPEQFACKHAHTYGIHRTDLACTLRDSARVAILFLTRITPQRLQLA